MSYATAQEVSDATPGATMKAALEAILSVHPAWTEIETIAAPTSPTGGDWTIWMNDGNDQGITFHIAIAPGSSTSMYFLLFEEYDSGTHLPNNIAPSPGNTYTPDASNATYSVHDSWSSINSNAVTGNTSNYTYWIGVNDNFIAMGATNSTYPTYIGVYEPYFDPNGNEFPVCMLHLGNSDGDAAGSRTRRPGREGVSMSDCFSVSASNLAVSGGVSTVGGTATPEYEGAGEEEYWGGQFRLEAGNGSYLAGRLPVDGDTDLAAFYQSSSVGGGDTLTVGGDSYICINGGTFGAYGTWINTTM